MTKSSIKLARAGLGRPERTIDLQEPRLALSGKRILIAGAAGAVGQPLVTKLREWGIAVVPTDVDITAPWGCQYMDVTSLTSVLEVVRFHEPDILINLAAAKLAPAGEVDPFRAVDINLLGTMNLLRVMPTIILASTCKSILPETTYGATKLAADRMVMNAGGTVVRYVNIPECGPSMLDVWNELPEYAPIPVTPCTRYVMSQAEAVALTIWACVLEPGRYKVNAGDSVSMADYASRVYPGREQVEIPPRRGDRIAEPLIGPHEHIEATRVPFIERVVSNHDA